MAILRSMSGLMYHIQSIDDKIPKVSIVYLSINIPFWDPDNAV